MTGKTSAAGEKSQQARPSTSVLSMGRQRMSAPSARNKRRLIKDPVWGNLEVFRWESQLLNHYLFNRLHNVVQNSSAYKVYPGLKYSRFLHSVGVSHVATQMFLNAVANATTDAGAALTEEARLANEQVPENIRSEIAEFIGRSFPCPPDYAVLLAAIRIVALIHDIGHLPFSHVFENAVEAFCEGEFGDAIKITPVGQERRTELIKWLAVHRRPGSDLKLHEILGRMFVRVLMSEAKTPVLSGLLKVAAHILEEDDMRIAKGFIIGTVDADRIDFVRRDGFFSGLFSSSVDFGRMFAFYELAPAQHGEENLWLPRPSPRTASDTESLLLERFQDYKYIVVHHRVHLYDEIIENILVRLMADGALEPFMHTLCELLKFDVRDMESIHGLGNYVETLERVATAFDDPWIETEIRHKYGDLKKADAHTKLLVEAYVEDRHCFRSAFKTDEEFQHACTKYAPLLVPKDLKAVTMVRDAFGASKYVLQARLSDLLHRTVLIGATDKKLNYGMRDGDDANFVGTSDLHDFLKIKKLHSLTFNFWYATRLKADDDDEEERKAVIKEALPIIEEAVTKQLQLPIKQ